MTPTEDIVWDTITDSAKKRFDYNNFKKIFEDLNEENVAENILFLIILGYVDEKSNSEIIVDINNNLLLLGCSFTDNDLRGFLENKNVELKNEIRAADVALSLLSQGVGIPGILVQIRSILTSK